jgi:hypothetical protein
MDWNLSSIRRPKSGQKHEYGQTKQFFAENCKGLLNNEFDK